MVRLSSAGKYVRYLVIAAVLLPLIFIAEVIYVERQQANNIGQVQTEMLVRLRAEAGEAWLSSQASYIRGIANLNTVTAGQPESAAAEFSSFINAETGFLVLGYAGIDGKVQVDTNGVVGRHIGDNTYFIEASSGREYRGQVPGNEWQQEEAVTVLAMPVTVRGEIAGIVYGAIRQETIKAIAAKLVPETALIKPTLNYWFLWLGGVYLLGVIPLLLLVYFLRRSQVQTADPVPGIPVRQQATAVKQSVVMQQEEPVVFEPAHAELIAVLQQELAIAGKRSLTDKIREPAVSTKKLAAVQDTTPAAVIDKVLAIQAYKAAPRTSFQAPPVPITMPENRQEAKPVVQKSQPSQEQVACKEFNPTPPALDALTGLYSRSEFEKIIAAGDGQPDRIIVTLSIDGMKVINDFLGEKTGDAIIAATADIAKTMAGAGCAAARFDGDKFVLHLTGTSPDMLEDIKKDVKYYIDLHNLRNPELPLSITIGAAAAAPKENLHEVWKRAERDMESHKAVNRVEARKFIMWSMKRRRGRS